MRRVQQRQGAGSGADGGERLFVGVPLPAILRDHVRVVQETLQAEGVRNLRLLAPEQLHVTLAFIGEVDPGRRETARLVVEQLPVEEGGEAELGGFLLLPSPRRARVVALEIEDGKRVLHRLYEAVVGGLEAAGVMRREARPFRPHLTIARLRQPAALQPRWECGRHAYPVESVRLYRSHLGPGGARYTVLAARELGATGSTKA